MFNGGFPINEIDGCYYWLNNKLSPDLLKSHVIEALGLSGILTFANKSNLDNKVLGEKCLELDHNWGLNWITIGVVFVGYDHSVEKAFLRNKTFYESWIANSDAPIYVMNGSLKDFKKFVGNKNDTSFDPHTREAMRDLDDMLGFIWKKDNINQFYPTPSWLSDYISQYIAGPGKILEPSAGKGDLLDSIRGRVGNSVIDCFEIEEDNRKKLTAISGVNLIGSDFLEAEPNPIYDYVVASPPFSNGSDVEHIKKMFEFIKIGGRIITTASGSNTQKLEEFLKSIGDSASIKKIILPTNSFGPKSDNKNSLLLIIDRLK